MLKACKNSKNYKGIRYPQCDRGDGEPCAACLKKWLTGGYVGRAPRDG